MDFMTVAEAAEIIGIDKTNLRLRAANGTIPGATQLKNGLWLIPGKWVKQLVAEKEAAKKMLNVTEAAKLAGVSRQMIYMALSNGKISGTSFSKGKKTEWHVDKDSLQKYMEKKSRK